MNRSSGAGSASVAGGRGDRDRDAGERRVRGEVVVTAEDRADVGPEQRGGQPVLVEQLDDLGDRHHAATGSAGGAAPGWCRARPVSRARRPARSSCSSLTSPWCHPGTLVSRLTIRRPATSYTRSCGSSDSWPNSSREYAARSSWLPMHHTTWRRSARPAARRARGAAGTPPGSAMSARSPVKTSACGGGSIRASRSRAASSRATVSIASYCRASPASRWMSLRWATTWVGGGSWPYWITSESVRTRRSPVLTRGRARSGR